MSRLQKMGICVMGSLWLLGACAHQAPVQTALKAPFTPALQTSVRTAPLLPLADETWVLVDTKTETLTVMKGNKPVETFGNIALGSSGAGIKRQRGDNKTPLGVFRIGWMNDRSRFNRFFGLDYPNLDYAEQAYREKRISEPTYYAIRSAVENGHTPPQTTPLGGFIGIHGLGAGSPKLHAAFDWTDGCVALDNQQIQRLAQWVQVGTRVEIR